MTQDAANVWMLYFALQTQRSFVMAGIAWPSVQPEAHPTAPTLASWTDNIYFFFLHSKCFSMNSFISPMSSPHLNDSSHLCSGWLRLLVSLPSHYNHFQSWSTTLLYCIQWIYLHFFLPVFYTLGQKCLTLLIDEGKGQRSLQFNSVQNVKLNQNMNPILTYTFKLTSLLLFCSQSHSSPLFQPLILQLFSIIYILPPECWHIAFMSSLGGQYCT